MASILEQYRKQITNMVKNSHGQTVITKDNVYQEANKVNRKHFYEIMEDLLLPGSQVKGYENLQNLFEKAQAGESCLLLMEHYSNFDLPALFYLIEKDHPEGKHITEALVAIAGFKLNEEDPMVLAFTEAFSRIVIYPSRSMASITDPEKLEEEKKKSGSINHAAMKAMTQAKNNGKIILVFPAGTRYRPGDPSTKKGLKEIDTYLRSFNNMVLVSINGNTLEINKDGGMIQDTGKKDILTFNVGPVTSTKEFRNRCREECGDEDPQQYTGG
jgi:glycerol-3-phosphate O-acyltransferase